MVLGYRGKLFTYNDGHLARCGGVHLISQLSGGGDLRTRCARSLEDSLYIVGMVKSTCCSAETTMCCIQCRVRPEECVRSPGARVTGGCEPSHVDAGSQTPVLCKSNKYP